MVRCCSKSVVRWDDVRGGKGGGGIARCGVCVSRGVRTMSSDCLADDNTKV